MGGGQDHARGASSRAGWPKSASSTPITSSRARLGVSIPTIFEIEGESGFATADGSDHRRARGRDDIVLAPAAARFTRPASRPLLKQNGTVPLFCTRGPRRFGCACVMRATGRCCTPPTRAAASPSYYAQRDPLYRDSRGPCGGVRPRLGDALRAHAGAAAIAAGRRLMHTLEVQLAERSYPIHVGQGLLARALRHATRCLQRRRVVIVSNPVVAAYHLARLRAGLAAGGPRRERGRARAGRRIAQELRHAAGPADAICSS
jgi:hypothetical protein